MQKEALHALEETRRQGSQAGLVVLATGLGKTWLSAFDSNQPAFRRVLYVAHREEILEQALQTFRRIRPAARLGYYTGQIKDRESDILFASVQTLGRQPHLQTFDPAHFDYLIIDEFHHAAARTYRRLIAYFRPIFLLGLTATPERTDGGDLLGLCGENLVYRCNIPEGIQRELLCPFHYSEGESVTADPAQLVRGQGRLAGYNLPRSVRAGRQSIPTHTGGFRFRAGSVRPLKK